MLFPNEHIIFEIPIYSMSELEFQKRWSAWKENIISEMAERGNSKKEIEESISLIMNSEYPKNVWKYNQIVGIIEIKVTPRDIVLNENRTLDTRIHAVAKAKHFIQDLHTSSMHFPTGKMSNEDILAEIDAYLNDMECRLPGKMCLCRDTYNNIKRHIDFLGIQKQVIEETKNIH